MHRQKPQNALNILSQIWVYTENAGIKRHLLELSSLHSVLLKFYKKSKMVHEYAVTYLSYYNISEFLFVFFSVCKGHGGRVYLC